MRSSPLAQTSMDLNPSGNVETSIKQKFQAIWASLALTMPVVCGDRLEAITTIILNDHLTDLDKLSFDDLHPAQIDAAVIAIAIGAYWHHDLGALRSRLLELQSQQHDLDINIQEFVLAYAIAYGCQGKITPKQLINQICQDFTNIVGLSRQPEEQRDCLKQLQLAQKFVEQGASAIAAHSYGNSSSSYLSEPIASSLYYGLSTPHSWALVTQRAQRPMTTKLASQITTIQAGAIAAAYGALSLASLIDQPQPQLQREIGKEIGASVWKQWAGVHCDRLLLL